MKLLLCVYLLSSCKAEEMLVNLWKFKKKKTPSSTWFKGGYLDSSHLTKLEIYITEIYMKKQYNSSITKNHKIKKKKKFSVVFPLKAM